MRATLLLVALASAHAFHLARPLPSTPLLLFWRDASCRELAAALDLRTITGVARCARAGMPRRSAAAVQLHALPGGGAAASCALATTRCPLAAAAGWAFLLLSDAAARSAAARRGAGASGASACSGDAGGDRGGARAN